MMSTESKLSDTYQKKTDIEHILQAPDTYVGSIETCQQPFWLYNASTMRMEQKEIDFNPALFKLFDEAIVNCRDHVVRMEQSTNPDKKLVTSIHVDVNKMTGELTLKNTGDGIDVAIHPEHGVWIPEMIFTQLRTSTNYTKQIVTVGGKNGYGFKLVVIWSTYVRIETIDHIRRLRYVQIYRNNCSVIEPPIVTPVSATTKPFTSVSFIPDYQRLGFTDGKLTQDMFDVFHRRTIDIAGVSGVKRKLSVYFNEQLIPVQSFQQYVDLFIGAIPKKAGKKPIVQKKADDAEEEEEVDNDGDGSSDMVSENSEAVIARVYDKAPNDHWEMVLAVIPTQSEFTHLGFVNGIFTQKGGQHVQYVANQLVLKLSALIEQKKKVHVNHSTIKETMFLFLRADIHLPAFDSQTKDYLTTSVAQFGSRYELSPQVIEKIAKMGIMDHAAATTKFKEQMRLTKTINQSSGKKSVVRVDNYTGANWAGTTKSKHTMLVITEGNSAKTGFMSGFSTQHDSDVYGLFSSRGKWMNVRKETDAKVFANKEIMNLTKILGLKLGQTYTSMEEVHKHLRYGRICFLTDQDLDGSHIKGLLLNLFHCQWRSLLTIPGFLCFMNTPLMRATRRSAEVVFYHKGEYDRWFEEGCGGYPLSQWQIKYYKGLGTSTKVDWLRYMKEPRFVDFVYTGNDSDEMLELAFSATKIEQRKEWIMSFRGDTFLDTSEKQVTLENFVNLDLIYYSHYDCARSLPSMMDGLKTSTRKILFGCLKRNLVNEVKVAQLVGNIGEVSDYHHGETSLKNAIIGMAQTFVGSNNVNLLVPCGQFGSRMENGKDAAADRYIFTKLHALTKLIFRPEDDAILTWLTSDDGDRIEPTYYLPVIPFIFVNGSDGIGTGFSCTVLPYHPMEVLDYVAHRLRQQEGGSTGTVDTRTIDELWVPYYRGFTGTITQVSPGKCAVEGRYSFVESTRELTITEPTLGMAFEEYKNGLKELEDEGKISRLTIHLTDEVFFASMVVSEPVLQINHWPTKVFKLSSYLHSTNMHAWGADGALKRYFTLQEMVNEYFGVRLEGYGRRKEYLLHAMERELRNGRNKKRFVEKIVDGTLDLRSQRETDLPVHLQQDHGLDEEQVVDEGGSGGDGSGTKSNGYGYLLNMRMVAMTSDRVMKLQQEVTQLETEWTTLKNTTPQQLWLHDLQQLRTALEKELSVTKVAADAAAVVTGGKKASARKRSATSADMMKESISKKLTQKAKQLAAATESK
jgi:DNA topoisomerase-2